jgi:YARHG domain
MRVAGDEKPRIVAEQDDFADAKNKLQQRHHDLLMAGEDFDSLGIPNFSKWVEFIKSIGSKIGPVSYFAKVNGRRLFYATDPKNKGKMGIFDENAQVVVRSNFDDIGGIGILLPNAVEVRIGKKLGIMGLDGTVILLPNYDAILPVYSQPIMKFWALQNGQWAALDENAKPVAVSEEFGSAAAWTQYFKEMPLATLWNPTSPQFVGAHLYSCGITDGEARVIDEAVFRAPIGLAMRGIVKDMHQLSFEYNEGESQTIKSVAINEEGNLTILEEFAAWGEDGRSGYHNVESVWVVFDPESNDSLQKMTLKDDDLVGWQLSCPNGPLEFVGDSMIIAHNTGELLAYVAAPRDCYFRILKNGKVQRLYPERDFPAMSCSTVDQKMLGGCFSGFANEEEAKKFKSQNRDVEYTDLLVQRQASFFRITDLDYLVNEVYASYGYIFKKPEWQKYYAQKPWYKGIHADVESMLTPLERKNIEFVRKLQQEMQGKETQYTKAQLGYYIAAG